MKRLGQERVSRQQGYSFPEHLVVGGNAPSQVVVVERRKIVVDDGVGMDELESAREGKQQAVPCSEKLARGQHQDRAESFSPGENTVMHRPVKRLRVFF